MVGSRVTTKVGDIFEVDNTSPIKYLQLVHIDLAAMNSDVIVVFEDEPEDYDFYMHTTVSQGVREGLWHKVGRKEVTVDLGQLVFKSFIEAEFKGENRTGNIGIAKTKNLPA